MQYLVLLKVVVRYLLSVVLAERCNCIESSAIVIMCLSSVMRVHCDKTTEVRIMQFSLKCSPMPYLFACRDEFEEVPLDRGLKLGRGGFRSISQRYISETVRDRDYVTINDEYEVIHGLSVTIKVDEHE